MLFLLCNCLFSGDYDGDLMSAFWQPELLEHFKPADPRFADEPSTVEKCLVKSQTTVTEFLGNEEGREISLDQKISRLQEHLLAPLKDASIVGKYSKYWENSIYANGYSHEETVRLAYMCVFRLVSTSSLSALTK